MGVEETADMKEQEAPLEEPVTQGSVEPAPTPAFKPITSQEDLDVIIEKRLTRERRKYADYDQLKAKAAQVDQTAADLAKALAKVEAFEQADRVRSWREQTAKDSGIPAHLLRGESLEELSAHANELKEYLKPRQQVVERIASAPEGSATSEQELARLLFGN